MDLSLDALKEAARKNNLSQEDYFVELVRLHTMTSQEVLNHLEISKQRLFNLKKTGRLIEIKTGLFLTKSVEDMRYAQLTTDTINKYRAGSEENPYELTPAYKPILATDNYPILLINKLRFNDCVTMVKYEHEEPKEHEKSEKSEYEEHLKELLEDVIDVYRKSGFVYLTKHEGFDRVETSEDLLESEIIIQPNDSLAAPEEYKGFTVERFYDFLTKHATILGKDKISNYNNTLIALKGLMRP